MGSLAGGLLSYGQLKKGNKALKRQAAAQKRAAARAEAMTPAQERQAEGAVQAASEDLARRKGVQATFTDAWTGVDDGGVGA